MKHFKPILLIPILAMFASCDVEFSPNAEWKNIPVVYCVLDQDDDTTYVRVQRCFLGDGDHTQYATMADSIYYPQGEISVLMEEWRMWIDEQGIPNRYGDSPRKIYNFTYTEIVNKEEGPFYNTRQPVFFCPTAGQLDTSYLYCLKVVDNNSGDTIAWAETTLIKGTMSLHKPNNVTLFQFGGTAGSKTCEITWSALRNARQYQPMIRFHYRDFIINRNNSPWDTTITPHHIDIPCNTVKSNMRNSSYTTYLDQNYFLSTIKNAIGNDTCNKNIIDTVDVFIYCCTEDLAAYIYAGNPAGALSQEPFTYTNINGGLGVFAARRHHISFRIGTPISAVSDYVKKLKELHVGF